MADAFERIYQDNSARVIVGSTKLDIVAYCGESAWSDYKNHLGKVLLAQTVCGWVDHDSVEIHCNPPAKVRVIESYAYDVLRECCGHLDPYWNVELVEPHPQLANVRSLEVYGPSYTAPGLREPPTMWEWIEEPKQWWWVRLRRWWRGPVPPVTENEDGE